MRAPLSRAACVIASIVLASAAAAQTITSYELDPLVVELAHPVSVQLTVRAIGVDSVALDLDGGASRTLTNAGAGVWQGTISAAEAVAGYGGPESYVCCGHNHVAMIGLVKGGVKVVQYNLYVNVLEPGMPAVATVDLAADARLAPHVLALYLPQLDAANPDHATVTQRLYQLLPDDFDLLDVVIVPDHFANPMFVNVSNSVQGIGLQVPNAAAYYGSGGRLQGFEATPRIDAFDGGGPTLVHELGHRWINWLDIPSKLQGAKFHWPLSTLAQSVMGFSGTAAMGYEGLTLACNLVALSGGDYRCDRRLSWQTFNDMDLYLMGLLPASQVGTHQVFLDQAQTPTWGGVLHGPTVSFTVQDVVDVYGPRLPAYPNAPHVFSVGSVVASRNRLPTAKEMAFLEYFAARTGARAEVSYSSGKVGATNLPFGPATGGRACLVAAMRYAAPALDAPSAAPAGAAYTVVWSASNSDGTYEVHEATSAAFASPTVRLVTAASADFTHAATAPTTYWYRVRAVDPCGGTTRQSAWSSSATLTVKPGMRLVRPRLRH